MLFLLPILTFLVYIFSIIKLLNKKDEHTNMFIFLTTTPLIISFIDTVIIYHFHNLNNNILTDNFLLFILIILVNMISCLLKSNSFLKDQNEISLRKSSIFDMLSLVSLILVLVFFR